MPAEELGYIIFTSVRQDLDEENLYILLRILWLKANIFLCQGDIDVVIETLELVRKRSTQRKRITFKLHIYIIYIYMCYI